MENKKWILGLIAFVIIVAVAIIGFSKINTQKNTDEQNKTISGAVTESFFDENATIMMFYSDQCGWCTKEKEVLNELAPEGYRVKPMDVGTNPDLWKQYNINGTPTFIAANGDRQEGYMEKDALKAWLDAHK